MCLFERDPNSRYTTQPGLQWIGTDYESFDTDNLELPTEVGVISKDGKCATEEIDKYTTKIKEKSTHRYCYRTWYFRKKCRTYTNNQHYQRELFNICKADGEQFKPTNKGYAVLKLEDNCPDGSVEVSKKFFDVKKNDNMLSSKNPDLRFCYFKPQKDSTVELPAMDYEVFDDINFIDVGVLPDSNGKCPTNVWKNQNKKVYLYKDGSRYSPEIETNDDSAYSRNLAAKICKVDSAKFKPLENGQSYKVLKLDNSCPSNSKEVKEDRFGLNLSFCEYKKESEDDETISALPKFDINYRVFIKEPLYIGVIPNDMSCPTNANGSNELIQIYMDDEDRRNANRREGWRGAISQDRNTLFRFCKVNGDKFKSLNSYGENYAVLKLDKRCPNDSIEFVRYFDNEDSRNANWSSGNIYPNSSTKNTTLHFCFFKGKNSNDNTMNSFPEIGIKYGVFAPSNFSKSLESGYLRTDDEDWWNGNKLYLTNGASSSYYNDIKHIVHGRRNTTMNLSRVRSLVNQKPIKSLESSAHIKDTESEDNQTSAKLNIARVK
jgi:hypothetical protein